MPTTDEMSFSAEVKSALGRIALLHDILWDLYHQGNVDLEPSFRNEILLGSLLKLLNQAEVVAILSTTGRVEEILSIARTMAEVAVNGAYLQVCENKEIDRFRHFETQAIHKHAKKLRNLLNREPSQETEEKIQRAIKAARNLTGRKEEKPSWTDRSLLQRAEYFDTESGLGPLMTALALTVYAWGHRAIHGTYDALAPFIRALPNDRPAFDAERQEELAIGLLAVSFVLFRFGRFMGRQLRADVDAQLIAANSAVWREI